MGSAQLLARCCCGGVLMGLANLVPGISGGTMLLAAGIYPAFIDAIADLTRLRFHRRAFLVVGCVAAAALVAILLCAGLLKALVVGQRWVMYSLFIGLTLGGVPVVWRLARPVSRNLVVAATLSFSAMVVLAVLQANGVIGSPQDSPLMLLVAGLAGASAMILPGLSGGYLLLLLGQYVPILDGIDAFKDALQARDVAAAMEPFFSVMLPVGCGVVAGVVVVGNVLQYLLHRHRIVTLGVLLGLLLGSVVGLYPFQNGVPPRPGDVLKGREVTLENIETFEPDDWRTEVFTPSAPQVLGSVLLILLGLAATTSIDRMGAHNPHRRSEESAA